MKRRSIPSLAALLAVLLTFSWPPSVLACAACFGQSDSKLASGMNWGIFTLLGVVIFVLSGFASFMVYVVRKSDQPTPPDKSTPAN